MARWMATVLSFTLLSTTLVGCGYSEEEYQKQVKEVDRLKGELGKLSSDKKKCDDDLATLTEKNAQLNAELAKLTGQAGDLAAQSEEQKRLIEKLKREKEQLDKIKARFEQLKQKLQALTQYGLTVKVRNNRIVINLPGDVLFDAGKINVKKEGKTILLQVAEVISKDANLASRNYQVAGHTDGKPYAGEYKDNWGLSVMRAREVLVYLVGPKDGKDPGGGLDPKHWSATGYGETDPIDTNDTDEGRKHNRRVELVVMPNVEEMLDISKL